MNLVNYPRKKYSITQFTQPQCSELQGQSFRFIMDDGRDFDLKFTEKDTVLWNWVGEEPAQARYQCLKSDDATYLVDYELEEFTNTFNRVNHLFVIDLEQRLVTRGIHAVGNNPRLPYLIKSDYTFGAIEVEGMELPFKRHSFTSELLGTRVEWHWATDKVTRHSYFSSSFYRFSFPGDELLLNRDVSVSLHRALPSQDDTAQYIKIKNKMYLFTLTEEKAERVLSDRTPNYRSNNMSFLQNYDRMYHVGRTFGNILDSNTNEIVPCHIQFGAFGNPVAIPEIIVNADNPYTT